jgi:hypothetical protein
MNFLLTDDDGKVIARSRSLATCAAAGTAQQEYAKQSELTIGTHPGYLEICPNGRTRRRSAQTGRLSGAGGRG